MSAPRCVALFTTLLIVGCSSAQIISTLNPGTNNQQRYTVSGSVVNSATGEPISRALVRLQGPEMHSTLTDADGRFEIQNVPAGQYRTWAQRPGFFSTEWSRPFTAAKPVTVGTLSDPLVLKLAPLSSIEGHVVDENGEPVEDLQVEVLAELVLNGRKTIQMRNGAATDSQGNYRIDDLQPGKYFVRTMHTPLVPNGFFGAAARSITEGKVYPERYYPDAPEMSSAQVLRLEPGQSARADFRLSLVPAFRVSGSLVSSSMPGMIDVVDENGNETSIHGGFGPKPGFWSIGFVPSGSWTIRFHSADQQGNPDFADVPLQVKNAAVRNVQVVLEPLPSIPIRTINPPSNEQPNLQARLVPRAPNAAEIYANRGRTAHDSLAFRNVLPGAYRVVVTSFGKTCIDSVAASGVDLAREELTVTAGSEAPPIDVTLGQDCAKLTVSMQSQDPNAAGVVLIASDSNTFAPIVRPVSPMAVFDSLPPGTYKVTFIPEGSDVEYMNPEVLRNLNGEQITLAPNQVATLSLNRSETQAK